MTDRELMQMVLEELEELADVNYGSKTVLQALRDRLAKTEPVHAIDISQKRVEETAKDRHELEPEQRMRIEHAGHVTTKPWPTQFDNDPSKWYEQIGRLPKCEWVGLTDEEVSDTLTEHHGWQQFAHAIEAKLKEKNS